MTRFAERRLGTVALSGMLGLTAAVTLVTTITATPAFAQATSTVEAFLAEARGHLEASRFSQAARAYGEALRLDPNNTEAREGQRIANQLLNRGPVLPDQGQATDRDVIRQAIRVEVDDALNRSRDELRRNNFGAARTIAIEAKVRGQSASDLFSPSELSQMLDRADRLQADIDSAEESFRLNEAALAGQQARDNEAEQIRRAQEQEQITINEKLIRVRQLQLEQKYEEARTVVEEILFIDQRNPAALALRDILESSALYQEYARIQNQKERSYLRGNIDMQDRLILPTRNLSGTGRKGLSEVIQYPDDWVKLSLGRTTTAGFVDTPQNRAVLGTLQSTPVQVAFDNNRFDQVVTYLETVSGLPIYVDWKSLDLDAGLDETAEVNLNIGEVPMNIAMDRIMDQLGEDDETRPRYTVKDGILTIASDAALRKDTVMAVYDIKDLLFEIPQFDNAPDFDLDSAFGQGGGNGQGGGGGGGGFGGGGSGGGGGGGRGGGGSGGGGSLFGGDIEEADRRTREELIEQILDIIQEQVDPEGWVEAGGDTGTVQELNGNLIITNTNGNHRAIEGLLSQLRDIRSLQINMEGRILSVSSDWFEKIGIDLDLYFNTNSDLRANQLAINPLGRLSDFFGPDGQLLDPLVYGGASQFPDADGDGSPDFVAPFNAVNYGVGVSTPVDLDGDGIPEANSPFTAGLSTPLRATQGFTPIGVNQQSLDLLDIVGATTAFGSSVAAAAPALATGFSFLDDIQVDLLVEATQADQRSVVLTAPRLTFHNGQRAFIAIQQEEAFISGLTPITSEGAVAFQPDVDTVNSGIVLDVEAVASADRRYVCATVSFNQAQFLEFREIPFTGGAGGGGLGGGQAGTAEATIQLPIVAGSQLRTSVCVPDKGTVLLGGQRTTEEIEVETGVPVLSKIPFINRFFTNRQTSKQETTLLILLRPELIIQQEQEDTLYPGLSDQLGIGSFR